MTNYLKFTKTKTKSIFVQGKIAKKVEAINFLKVN